MRYPPVFAVLALIGCASAVHRTPQSAEMALRQSATAWTQSFSTRDPDQIISFFAEDATVWYPRYDQPVVGRAANREPWVKYFSARPSHPVSVESVTVAASGDLGYTTGKYLYTDESDLVATGGRYVAIWKPVDGEWKIVLLSAHSHMDVTGATFRSRYNGSMVVPP
jgi:ketosteroid isomerase-like protein